MTDYKVGDIVKIIRKQNCFDSMPIGTKLKIVEIGNGIGSAGNAYLKGKKHILIARIIEKNGLSKNKYLISIFWIERITQTEKVIFT